MAQGTGHLLDQNTVHLWRLDETSGNFLDAANPATHQLFIKGGVTRVMGLASGRACYLDGTGALQVTSPATLSDPQKLVYPQGNYTVEMWLKLNGEPPSGVCLFTIGRYNTNYYSLTYATNRSLSLNYATPSNSAYAAFTTGVGVLPKDRWFHLAVRKTVENPTEPDVLLRTNTFDVFIDGAKVHTVTGKANMGGTPSGTGDGGTYWNSMLYTFGSYPRAFPGEAVTLTLVGWLDDIRISNTARTDGELLADSQRGLPAGKDTSGYGHGVDTNALALWRFNEGAVTDGAYDEVSGITLPAVGSPPLVATAKVAGGRQFTSATTYFEGPAPADIQAALLGSFTWEGWVRLDAAFASGGATQSIWSIGLSGVVWLANVNLDRASQTLGFTWTNGANNYINSGYSAALRLELGVWTHVAVRKTWNGSSNIIEFFLNGTKRATSPSLVNPASITSPLMDFGRTPQVTGINFVGSIDDVRLSKVARTDQEIWNGFLSAAPAKGHAIDSDTLALWRCNEAAATDGLVDEMGTYPLTQTGSPGLATGRIGGARNVASGVYFSGASSADFLSAIRDADWSCEAWVKVGALGTYQYIFSLAGSGETEAANVVGGIYVDPSGSIASNWEYGAGVDSVNGIGSAATVLGVGLWYHVAVTKHVLDASSAEMKLYINGALISTKVNSPLPTGGTTAVITIGAYGPTGSNPLTGSVDDVRVSKKARTAAEILASYHQGLQYCTYTPAVMVDVPAPGHAVDGNTRFLWRLDEAAGTDPAADAVGAYPLTTVSGTPVVVAGKVGSGRNFGGTSYLSGPADAATVTKVHAGGWTLEGWFNFAAFGADGGVLGLGNGTPGNANWALYIKTWNATNKAYIGFGGGNGDVPGDLPLNQWFHWVITCSTPSGGNVTFTGYINGVSQGTRTAALQTSSPSNPQWFLGRSYDNGSSMVNGNFQADDIRFSNVVRTQAEITASFNAGAASRAIGTPESIVATPGTRGHTLDPYTVALWRMEDAATGGAGAGAADECSNFPMTVVGTNVINDGGNGKIGNCRWFNSGNSNSYLHRPAVDPYLVSLFTSGDWTLEFWTKGGSNQSPMVVMGGTYSSEVEADNQLFNPRVDGVGGFSVFWEQGAGVDVTPVSAAMVGSFPAYLWHIAFTSKRNGANVDFKVYLNGAQFISGTYVGPTGGTNARLFMGHALGSMYAGQMLLDDIRLSNKVRTSAEVMESYQRGFKSFSVTEARFWDGVQFVGADSDTGSPAVGDEDLSDAPRLLESLTPQVMGKTPITFPVNSDLRELFGVDTDALVGTVGSPPLDILGLTREVDGRVRLVFSEPILDSPVLRTLSNYEVSAPAGAPPVTITALEVGEDRVWLTLSRSELVHNQAYTVTVAPDTARSLDTGMGNKPYTSTFLGVSTPLQVVSAGSRYLKVSQEWAVRVVFNKPPRMHASATGALALSNYVIAFEGGTLAIFRAERISDTVVDLITAEQSAIPYVLTTSGVKDEAGNEVL